MESLAELAGKYVTFSSDNKHLARVIGVVDVGKKVIRKKIVVRRYHKTKKHSAWRITNDSLDATGNWIVLTDAEVEKFFPGALAAWEAIAPPVAAAAAGGNQ
jgi:hypothetical protein